jgi:hypothetical protein
LPPVTLLEDPKATSKQKQATRNDAALIVDTLASFSVDARRKRSTGPTVTQFGVGRRDVNADGAGARHRWAIFTRGQPHARVEVSRASSRHITSLQNDLALALAARRASSASARQPWWASRCRTDLDDGDDETAVVSSVYER